MSYLKPQTPMQLNDNYIYPLTTADQVILNNGNRLNSLFKKTIKETATLQVANWSDTLPYIQTITISESTDDYNVDANIVYNGNEADTELNKAAGCISYIKKNHKEITFYCLKEKPMINIPVEITGTCRNTIATVEEGIKLNFDIKAYSSEEEMLADTPMENTIGVITDVPITGYKFSATEPENMVEGEVWIRTGRSSDVTFNIVNNIELYPISIKQYVDNVFIDVVAMSYQNGKWIEWVTYLFKEGSGALVDTAVNGDTPSLITVSDNAITITGNGSYDWYSYSFDNIDLSDYSLLCIDVTSIETGSKNGESIGISKEGSGFLTMIWPSGDRAVYTIDISTISGECDITCNVQHDVSYIVHNVWLEY